MSSKKKPEWFPLKIYVDGPSSVAHWMRAIALRLAITGAPQPNEWKVEKFTKVVIEDNQETWVDDADFSDVLGVRDVTPYEAFKLSEMHDFPENSEAKRVAELCGGDAFEAECMRIKRQPAKSISDAWWDEFQFRVPVMVDLSLDDDTLKHHFEFWLNVQRDAAIKRGAKPGAFKEVNHDVLADWHRKRLLAAFDLMTWREISGGKYSDAAIARWLWPDSGPLADGSDADRAERFRKVTKPLVECVFDWHCFNRLQNFWKTENLFAHLATN